MSLSVFGIEPNAVMGSDARAAAMGKRDRTKRERRRRMGA